MQKALITLEQVNTSGVEKKINFMTITSIERQTGRVA